MPDIDISIHNPSQQQYMLDFEVVKSKILAISLREQITFGYINIVFMENNEHTQLNIKHLNHDFATDILTFDLSDAEHINTDLYINIDVAGSNAQEYNDTLSNELHRLIIHGLLHMSGYKDKNPEQQKQMRNLEDYYLKVSCET